MMTDEPYLVAHKVRGEPAFDIAIQQECAVCRGLSGSFTCDECESEGYWWIVATSGHRAHPYWDVQLDTLFTTFTCLDMPPVMPDPWPDHYAVNNPSHKPLASAGRSLLTALGLGRKAAPIKRRI